MGNCEICGKISNLVRCRVENIEVSVCEKCRVYGKVLGNESNNESKKKVDKKRSYEIFNVRRDYGEVIKKSREKLGLKQEEVAKKLSIKESLIHKIENNNLELSIILARKFEEFFNIKLIEAYEEDNIKDIKVNKESITIGDLLNRKV